LRELALLGGASSVQKLESSGSFDPSAFMECGTPDKWGIRELLVEVEQKAIATTKQ